MDKSYYILFRTMSARMEDAAEEVAQYDREHEDLDGEKTALTMRDDYIRLTDKLKTENPELSRDDYAKLLAAAYVIINGITNRIESEKKALHGYKIDIMPKLNRIINESTDDDGATKIAEELFTTEEN